MDSSVDVDDKFREDCSKQWEILLLLLSVEEKIIDRTGETEVDTMSYFCENESIRGIFMKWLHDMKYAYSELVQAGSESDTVSKCDKVALYWRQKGNDNFRSNLVEDSYHCYTKSVLYADQMGIMYPLALANRSAALLRMKKFKECLSDVELAIDNGYPAEQRHKLLLRRADCLIELGHGPEARAAMQAATDHVKTLSLSEAHKMEFERQLRVLDRKVEALPSGKSKEEDIVLPECYMGMNPNFNAASNAIELQRNEVAGRFVVSKEAVRRGDVLFSEEPYAWIPLPSAAPICEMCGEADLNLVPCAKCSRSVYCGEKCRVAAWSAFHEWECGGVQMHLFPTIGIAHLALRVLLVTASKGFPELPRPVAHPATASDVFQSYSDVDTIQIYKTDTPSFLRMFHLVTNFDKMNSMDYVQYAMTSATIIMYLEKFTSFFDYLPSRLPAAMAPRQVRLFAAALVLRSLGQLVCNGHATLSLTTVDENTHVTGRTLTEREVRRATAIYPSAAMMNHSCDPNIINTFHKNRLIIRCARELSPGAEVFNCYGPHRSREPTTRRRELLRAQYKFTCTCSACTDTLRRDFVLLFGAYACHACKGPVLWRGKRVRCQQCLAHYHPRRVIFAIAEAKKLMYEAEAAATLEERCEKTLAAFKLKQLAYHRHNCSLRAAADHLARLYAELGEFTKSIELIKQNIQSLECQFGSFSVEVAHEMRKLSDVMLERIITSPQNPEYRDWCLEAHKIVKKAVQLTELNYGPWQPLAARLREREALVAVTLAGAGARALQPLDCVHHNLYYNLKI